MNKISISFSHVLEILGKLPSPDCLWLAYSGGMDSSVLLHLFAMNRMKLPSKLVAVHVNHNLSPFSETWVNHCKSICEKENIELKIINIDAKKIKGTSQEAYARELRYAAIGEILGKSDLLLTAHHQNDQAETLIQQMMRGAGPEGLSAMPEVKQLTHGWLVRPFLGYSGKQINDYAEENGLVWIEDESNLNTDIDRNYIRSHVIPYLQQRWPSTVSILTRSARHQSDTVKILVDVAEHDLKSVTGHKPDCLNINELTGLSESRMRNAIRYWLKMNNHQPASTAVLDNIIKELIYAGNDKMPCIKWHNTEIRRYRNNIYVMKPIADFDSHLSYSWHLDKPLDLDNGRLEAMAVVGSGIKSELINNNLVHVCFRTGGEVIRPAGRKETHTLKKLFQETGVPPWQRDRVPLIYVNDRLAAVTDYWIDEYFNAKSTENAWKVSFIEHQVS